MLVVDDEPCILDTFRFNYEDRFKILTATGGAEALEILAREPVAVLVTDQRMPGMSGIELIRRALDVNPRVVPILLTGYTDAEALVDAVNLCRIHRYVPKPWDRRDLGEAVTQAIERHHLACENERLAAHNARLMEQLRQANDRLTDENEYLRQRDEAPTVAGVVGTSVAIRRVLDLARRVADSPTTVLLEGETGTGKEVLAKAIHAESSRHGKLFVAFNTGAVTETLIHSELFGHRRGSFTGATSDKKGLFELADGGTLFLDEIGETSQQLQVTLLRVLQEREIMPIGAPRPVPVDVRVIAATNRDLEGEVRRGAFREDLFFRLKVVRLRIPPLRERLDDVPALARHFLVRHTTQLKRHVGGFAPGVLDQLATYGFPGNVRELSNMVERAVLLCEPGGLIDEEGLFERLPDVPPAPLAIGGEPPDSLQERVLRFEREQIREMLAECGGNKSRAARKLGLTYRGLLKKMQRHDERVPEAHSE